VLAGGIRHDANPTLESEHAGDADDLAVPTLDHGAAEMLAQEEEPVEVDVDHTIPGLRAQADGVLALYDPGVVDQDVDLAAFCHLRTDSCDGVVVRDVEIDVLDLTPQAPGHLTRRVLGARPAEKHQIRAGFGEAERNALA
jgi:hypothetical protein